MYLAYIDESYTDRRYWISAVLVDHEHVNEGHRQLRALVDTFAERHGIDGEVELHGHELFHGDAGFASVKRQVRARINLYRDALAILGSIQAKVSFEGFDRIEFRQRYKHIRTHHHRVCMTFILERIDEFAAQRVDHALIIADEHHETQYELLRDLRSYQEVATWGWKSRQLTQIVDTIHFVNSKTNMLVQAADLAVFLQRRPDTHVEADPRAQLANEKIWSALAPHVSHSRCWRP